MVFFSSSSYRKRNWGKAGWGAAIWFVEITLSCPHCTQSKFLNLHRYFSDLPLYSLSWIYRVSLNTVKIRLICMYICWASLVAQLVKNPPAMWDTWVLSPGWDDPLEKGTATHSSILAWRIPWTEPFVGSQRVGHDWATNTLLSHSHMYRLEALL